MSPQPGILNAKPLDKRFGKSKGGVSPQPGILNAKPLDEHFGKSSGGVLLHAAAFTFNLNIYF